MVRDDGQYGPDYKSRLYHIYNDADVKDDLNRKAEEQEPLPDLVTNGYYLLGKDWLETAKKWEAAGHKTPPVMITVAWRARWCMLYGILDDAITRFQIQDSGT